MPAAGSIAAAGGTGGVGGVGAGGLGGPGERIGAQVRWTWRLPPVCA